MIPAGYLIYVTTVTGISLWEKARRNIKALQSQHLQAQYEQYLLWLEDKVGANKAALYVNKHTHFLSKPKNYGLIQFPPTEQLLAVLKEPWT